MRPMVVTALIALLSQAASVQAAPLCHRVGVRSGAALVQIVPISPPSTALPLSGSSPSTRSALALPSVLPAQLPAGWRLQATVGNVLHAVSFSDPSNGYAAAELGAVYRTTNGGQSWSTVMNVGFPYYWYGVQAFSPQTALVVGFQNQSGAGVGRWTDDGGATWSADVVIDPGNWLMGLKFSDATHGIAYGNLGYVYVTQNGGRNAGDWTKVMTDPALGWLAGNFTTRTDGNVFITGINFCHSTTGGLSWTISHSADPVFDGGCSFPDLLHGWTGADRFRIRSQAGCTGRPTVERPGAEG